MIDNTLREKEQQWSLNAITCIHKSHTHSASQLKAKHKKEKNHTVKEMALKVSWEKYVNYLALSSRLSQSSFFINSSKDDPQLVHLVNNELMPMLRQKMHITDKCSLGECVEMRCNANRRPQSSQSKSTRYVVQMAHTKKEALEMHKQLLEENKFTWKSEEVVMKNDQAMSRDCIKYLGPHLYSPYNSFIYYAKDWERLGKRVSERVMQLKRIELNRIFLITGEEFELTECKVSDLAAYRNNSSLELPSTTNKEPYVLEKTSPYSLNYPEEMLYLRKLSSAEIGELIFSYTGIQAPNYFLPIEELVNELYFNSKVDITFAWIKANEGRSQFVIKLYEDTCGMNGKKVRCCKWPSCLCLCCDSKSCERVKSLSLAPVKFNALMSSPQNPLEALLPTLDLYKVKKLPKVSNQVDYSYCATHKVMALHLATKRGISIYSLYFITLICSEEFKEFDEMLKKTKTSSDFLHKIKSGSLAKSFNTLYEAALKFQGGENHSLEEVKKDMWQRRVQFMGIPFAQ
eukprot:TRINITY_DN12303_c0_g1_i2.p1 TRINITY_DN12303_c0_g1~~TRINITY_DN12303_c0_g1_i2.p1  ORF type:complete len:516 (+),score=44.97 TRINITY_DN12303_c0_g1_i2:495-2042(+)